MNENEDMAAVWYCLGEGRIVDMRENTVTFRRVQNKPDDKKRENERGREKRGSNEHMGPKSTKRPRVEPRAESRV